jgi:hypothetical protein
VKAGEIKEEIKMTVLERVAFTFALSWALMDAFMPGGFHAEKLKITIIVTLSIAYLFGLHSIIWKKVRGFLGLR